MQDKARTVGPVFISLMLSVSAAAEQQVLRPSESARSEDAGPLATVDTYFANMKNPHRTCEPLQLFYEGGLNRIAAKTQPGDTEEQRRNNYSR